MCYYHQNCIIFYYRQIKDQQFILILSYSNPAKHGWSFLTYSVSHFWPITTAGCELIKWALVEGVVKTERIVLSYRTFRGIIIKGIIKCSGSVPPRAIKFRNVTSGGQLNSETKLEVPQYMENILTTSSPVITLKELKYLLQMTATCQH